MNGKVIIFSAPSGAGKTTLVREVMRQVPGLGFSVSATSRKPRPGEVNGRDYYFIEFEEFKNKIERGEFVEWQEVYPGTYYGTLKSEVERLWGEGKHVIFDVDVVGGTNLKRIFGTQALAIFIQPPSLEVLRQRLVQRGTENAESIEKRLAKASYELAFAKEFDRIIINDKLDMAIAEALSAVRLFLQQA